MLYEKEEPVTGRTYENVWGSGRPEEGSHETGGERPGRIETGNIPGVIGKRVLKF